MRTIVLLFKVLWSPAEVMSVVAKNPCIGLPLLLLVGCSLASTAVVLTKIPDLPLSAIERSPQGMNISDEAKDRLRQQADSPATWIFTMVLGGARPVFVLLIVSGIYFLVFTIIGRQEGFRAFFSITAFAFLPTVFRQSVVVLSAWFVPPSSIMPDELGSLSPAVFLDRDSISPVVFAVMNMVDIVSMWVLALMIIGYAFVARRTVSRTVRVGAVIGVFLIYAAGRILIRTT
jgi:hypothetical protein